MLLKKKIKILKFIYLTLKGSCAYIIISENGQLKSEGGSITEGIGSSRVTANFAENAKIDGAYSQ